jgi:broad specificity phosphatase PhoE
MNRPPDQNRCLLYLFRHGDARPDGVRRYWGQTDLPLNAAGRRQALTLREKLAGRSFSACYCSDLLRCQQTAQIIAGPDRNDIRTRPALREIHLGEWEGQPMASIRQHHPEAFRQRGLYPGGFRPPGGESFGDLRDRVLPELLDILRQHQGRVLVVAHAGVNRILLARLWGLPIGEIFGIPQELGCLNLIERHGDRMRIRLHNFRPGGPFLGHKEHQKCDQPPSF